MTFTLEANPLTYLRPNADRSISFYNLNIVDDKANQNFEVCHQTSRLFDQTVINWDRFLPNESYLMTSSDIGGEGLNYLGEIGRRARVTEISSPMPKEDLPCVDGLVFVPIRNLTYSAAMSEIKAYIENVGRRKVYISELAEELQIDMDLIEQILNDIRRSSGIDSYV